jgi:hypothetical protein
MRKLILIGVLVSASLSLASPSLLPQAAVPLPVSIIELISRPKEFGGRLVVVRGMLDVDHHGYTLYLSHEDYLHALQENGIWFRPPGEMEKKIDALEGRYVIVVGEFSAQQREGFTGRQVGGLTAVRTCELWSDPKEPLRMRFRGLEPKQP